MTTLNLDINFNNQTNLQGIQNNLLQNEINAIVLSISYAGIVDGVYGVSILNQDCKLGLQLGITNPSLDNRIINLSATSILNNQEFQSFKLSTTSNLNTLNTFKNDYLTISGINVDNKLVNLDENIDSLYNICNDLGSTQNDLDITLDNNLVAIGISCSNNDIEINNVKSFLQGEIDGKVDSTDFTTLEGIVGGIGTAQGIADGLFSAYTFANEAWKANQDINNSYQSLQIDGVDDRLDDHDGQLEILTTFKNDQLGTTNPNFLTRNETTLPSTFTTWTGNNTKTINTNDTILINGNSTTSFLSFDNTHTSLFSKIGMNNGDMIFQNYDDNFIFKDTSNNEIFKINQSGNVLNTGNLTISGTLQSPITNLLSVSIANNTNSINNIIGVSMYNIDVAKNILGVSFNSLSISGTNYLTKNATILPSTFLLLL